MSPYSGSRPSLVSSQRMSRDDAAVALFEHAAGALDVGTWESQIGGPSSPLVPDARLESHLVLVLPARDALVLDHEVEQQVEESHLAVRDLDLRP